MDNSPLVSVLMTSYNREKYIAEAIESVLASTYTNFELIIVDDCSKDKTVEIAKSYEIKDKRVKVYLNDKNIGDYPNRNKVASYANGKYLKYLDSDDLLYPTGLQVLVTMMEKFPQAGYGLCSFMQDDLRVYPFQLSPKEAYTYQYQYKSIFHRAPLSSIIRKSAFEKVNGFTHHKVSGDYHFWMKISTEFPVVLLPDGIVWYRVHEGQEMQIANANPLKKFDYLKVEEYWLKHPNCPLDDELRNQALKKNNYMQKRFIIKTMLDGNFNFYLKVRRTYGR